MNTQEVPRVGIGVIIVNHDGKILIGKRIGGHAPYYSIPGGKLDLGESFESAAIREVKEETGLTIREPRIVGVANELGSFQETGKHFVSISLVAKDFEGELKVMEPKKCEGWQWVDPHKLPQPHFEASRLAVQCFLEKKFYIPTS